MIALVATRDRKQLGNRIALFLRQYARKSDARSDPNDRRYDRKIEEIIKRMNPQELDRLIRSEDGDAEDTPGKEEP